MVPDLLTGVKYFIGNQKGSKKQASACAGYGFENWKTIDGVDILKNKYSIGIGTLYDSYISHSEAEKLNYAQREQAMLQSIVLPDEEAEKLESKESSLKKLDVQDLELNVQEVPVRVKSRKHAAVDPEEKTITTDRKKASFVLRIPEVKNCQLLVSFKGLKKTGRRGNEEFTVFARKGNIKKAASDTIGNAQGFPDIEDLTLNMGYFEKAQGRIKITLQAEKEGRYTYDDIVVYAVPTDLYDKYAAVLQENRLQIEKMENDSIWGTFTAKHTSIAYFSILNDEGWSVYIDGEKAAKVQDTQLAFTGAVIPEGTHRIELRYHTPGLRAGMVSGAIGIAALLVMIFNSLIKNKNYKQSINKRLKKH